MGALTFASLLTGSAFIGVLFELKHITFSIRVYTKKEGILLTKPCLSAMIETNFSFVSHLRSKVLNSLSVTIIANLSTPHIATWKSAMRAQNSQQFKDMKYQ